MRALIHVPMIHSETDLGTARDEIRRRYVEVFGVEAWGRRKGAVEAMWNGIRQKLVAMPIRWNHTKLYQDGLPVCGREEMIVRDVAAQGSHNHQLLLDLIKQGATLMGTEDPGLLLREYHRIRALVQTAQQRASTMAMEALESSGKSLLDARDDFIANRIDATLGQDETGILFLGLSHHIEERLAEKFDLTTLIHNLPFGTDPIRRLKEVGHDDG